MDTVMGGNLGMLKQEVTVVTEMIGKLTGIGLPQNGLPQNDSSDRHAANESYGCRHCQETFTTLLNLQQHIVCEHTEELRTELNQSQHKKQRPSEEGGSIHPKKQKLLEAAQKEEQEKMVGNFEVDLEVNVDGDDDEDEDRLVINTTPTPPEDATSSPAQEEEYMSYPHKKLKRKDYLETKGEGNNKKEDLQKEYENIINKAKKEIDRENNEIREKLEKTELLYATAKFRESVQPETKPELVNDTQPSHMYIGPPHSVPINVPHHEIRGPYPPISQQQVPYPAINMNMYGNFAMPMGFPPHPMMYMNPGMFMPPMPTNQHSAGFVPQANPMPTSPLPSRVTQVPSPRVSPHALGSPKQEKKEKPKPARPKKTNRRNQKVERKGSSSDEKSEVVEIYECKVCCKKFSQVGNFHNHMKLHSEQACSCGLCDVEFNDSYELQRHMRTTHTGTNPYKCNECDREFGQYNNLRRHLRVHSGKFYVCNFCDRKFNELFYLDMHIGSHTGKRTYRCGVCNKKFGDSAGLQRHVKTHKKSELHTCEVCFKSYSKACVLRQHKKMHLGVRPFKCKECGKSFVHRHHLNIHMRMHIDSKPYACKFCNQEFTQTSHLYKHIQRQHKEEIDKAVDPNVKKGKKPSAAKIEELFCKIQIQSPSNSPAACVDNGNVETVGRPRTDSRVSQADGRPRTDSRVTQADSAMSLSRPNVNPTAVETLSHMECSSTQRYSPISPASSQCDNDIRSPTPTTEVHHSHAMPNGFHGDQTTVRDPAIQPDTKDSLSHTNPQGSSTVNPNHNENIILTADQSKKASQYHQHHIHRTCLKAEEFSILPDVSRISDTDQLSQEFRALRYQSASSPSLSPDCADQPSSPAAAILSPGSIKVEKREDMEDKPKKRRRRRKKVEMEVESESIATSAAPSPPPNSPTPILPPVMPGVPTDIQKMYYMQMQRLQDMHLALFANTMANPCFPNSPRTNHSPPSATLSVPPPYGYGNPMDVFSQPPQPPTPFPPLSQGRCPTPGSEVSGPMDLSVEKQI